MQEPPWPQAAKSLPPGVGRWNWGAFLLNWIWGLGNNTYVALFTLVPYAGCIMPFVLGVKGDEWAWRHGHWRSVEEFRRVQRNWALWGFIIWSVIIVVGGVVLGGAWYVLRTVEVYGMAVATIQTNEQATRALGTPIFAGFPSGKLHFNFSDGDDDANLQFSVYGPKAAGFVVLEATKQKGVWSIQHMMLQMENGSEAIDLLGGIRASNDAIPSFGFSSYIAPVVLVNFS